MKKVLMILAFASCFLKATAQQSINDYKYVIVEKKFHFQNEPNQYDLNELVRFLFKKHGFKPVLESDIFPNDLKSNYCLALQSEIIAKGFLRTKVTITLRDCNNNTVFEVEGVTKEKNFDKVYSYGIRDAFEKFNTLKYNYVPNSSVVNKKESKVLEPEIDKEKKETLVKLPQEQNSAITQKTVSEVKKPTIEITNQYKAVKIFNGFQLLDSTSNVVMTIFTSGVQDVFIVKGVDAIIYKKGESWIYSETSDKDILTKLIEIKF